MPWMRMRGPGLLEQERGRGGRGQRQDRAEVGLLLSSALSSSNSASFSFRSFSPLSFSILKAALYVALISSLLAAFSTAFSGPLERPPSSFSDRYLYSRTRYR